MEKVVGVGAAGDGTAAPAAGLASNGRGGASFREREHEPACFLECLTNTILVVIVVS